MAKAAIVALKNKKGSSHNAIEAYIKENFKDVDYKRHLLRKSLKVFCFPKILETNSTLNFFPCRLQRSLANSFATEIRLR